MTRSSVIEACYFSSGLAAHYNLLIFCFVAWQLAAPDFLFQFGRLAL
jgi:hypothetical protein